MARIRIDKPIRAVLLDELIAAGIDPLTPDGTSILQPDRDGNGGWLTVPDAQLAAAQAVIAAHDAATLDTREENRRKLFAADLLVLRNRLANTTVPWEKAAIRMIGRLLGEVYDQ